MSKKIEKLRKRVQDGNFVSFAEKRRLERFLKDMEKQKEKELSYERQVEIIEFYSLAQKYGFCHPYCECELCN